MTFADTVLSRLHHLRHDWAGSKTLLDRVDRELDFAVRLIAAHPEYQAWESLVLDAIDLLIDANRARLPLEGAIDRAEALLAPIGTRAKQYTIHCIGHAHIDMNWLWNWPETVATVNDTFTTIDRLMEEFPDFTFSQSQTSIYHILRTYLPELYARVKQRVREGRWEITAAQWVEGDKNLASGEILARHVLYTKRFFHEEFDLPYATLSLDFEPDTFGHARTLPTILAHGGVTRYYLHRGLQDPGLFWWQGKDGSRVLVVNDWRQGYNGSFATSDFIAGLLENEKKTGMQDWRFVYGVGDHGGGPTRDDLQAALTRQSWPIYPRLVFSTYDAYYRRVEEQATGLPVIDEEINFVFEGCYTAQSNIKHANRQSENALVEAEWAAILGHACTGMPYPTEHLLTGWRHAMFNQFHDILPGSGMKATYQFSQGLLQEIVTLTAMIKTRALRAIAATVNTRASAFSTQPAGPAVYGVKAGVNAEQGSVSSYNLAETACNPLVVFNPSPWERTEMVVATIWNRDWPDHQFVVKDDRGQVLPGQVVYNKDEWSDRRIDVAFPAPALPAGGYRSFTIAQSAAPGMAHGCSGNSRGVMENEFFRVQVEEASGAFLHLIDKRTGIDLVPAGERLGLLEYLTETPAFMSAWCVGQPGQITPLQHGAIDCPFNGPYLATVRANHKFGTQSTATLVISLAAGVPRLDFSLEVDWREIGSKDRGIPALRVAFPLAISDTVAVCECPAGSVTRPTDPTALTSYTNELFKPGYTWPNNTVAVNPGLMPAQKWVDLTGHHAGTAEPVGATLLNMDKYGFAIEDHVVRMSLLRSSFDPDPLPEWGVHTIKYALRPHVGAWSVSEATRAGYDYNLPVTVVGTTQQDGTLPASQAMIEIRTPNVMLSGCKQAEDSAALVLRLYEMEGQATTAEVWLHTNITAPNARVLQTDLLEQPLAENTASFADGVLRVAIPAYGLVTVKIG